MILSNEVALITGAASGMGEATAKLFAKEGAKVMIADINDEGGKRVVREIAGAGGEALYIHADMAKLTDLAMMMRETVAAYGKMTIFFHNAGIPGPGWLENTTEDGYDRVMAVNAKAAFFSAKYAAVELRKAGGGNILFNSSTAGIRPSHSSPSYSMSKAGINMLTRNLALYLAKDNIRVNCLCPGAIETPLTPAFLQRNAAQAASQISTAMQARRAIKRMGRPEEFAEAALFLVKGASSFITGVLLPVDGGSTAN